MGSWGSASAGITSGPRMVWEGRPSASLRRVAGRLVAYPPGAMEADFTGKVESLDRLPFENDPTHPRSGPALGPGPGPV